jgi:hypothetical protein
MGKGMCGFWFEPLQIEHPYEKQGKFMDLLCMILVQ